MSNIFKSSLMLENRGILIQVEGPDGSGKTSVLNELCRKLDVLDCDTLISNWNETTELYNLMMRLNLRGELTSKTRCIFGGAELAARQQYVIGPALSKGAIVFVPKYLISLKAHSLVRGHSREFLDELYSFALVPDLTLYLDVPPAVALERKRATCSIGFWEAGLDLAIDAPLEQAIQMFRDKQLDPSFVEQSFIRFQTRLRELHMDLLPSNTYTIDSTQPILKLVDGIIRLLSEEFPQFVSLRVKCG